jgi:hypothetical protein
MKMSKLVATAAQADANICNVIRAPTQGCHAGGGIHVVIPVDWATRIAAAQDVPGCSYSRVEADGTMLVDDYQIAQLATPAVINSLTVPQQTAAAALNVKLSTAVVVTASVG